MFANIFGKNSKEKIIHFSLKNSNLTLNNRLNYNNCNIFTEKEKIFKYFKNYQYNYWNNPIKNRIKTKYFIFLNKNFYKKKVILFQLLLQQNNNY